MADSLRDRRRKGRRRPRPANPGREAPRRSRAGGAAEARPSRDSATRPGGPRGSDASSTPPRTDPRLAGRGLPVIDGKHLAPFRVSAPDNGHAHRARDRTPAPARTASYRRDRLAYRDVSGVANRQSLIAAVVPAGVVTTHTVFCLRTHLPLDQQHFLCACFNSYVVNAIVRLLMGGHVTTALVEDLPIPVWRGSALDRRIARMGRRLARPPQSPDVETRLQAAVARRFGLDATTFAAHSSTAFRSCRPPIATAPSRRCGARGETLRYSRAQCRTTASRSTCRSASAATPVRSRARRSTTFPSA